MAPKIRKGLKHNTVKIHPKFARFDKQWTQADYKKGGFKLLGLVVCAQGPLFGSGRKVQVIEKRTVDVPSNDGIMPVELCNRSASLLKSLFLPGDRNLESIKAGLLATFPYLHFEIKNVILEEMETKTRVVLRGVGKTLNRVLMVLTINDRPYFEFPLDNIMKLMGNLKIASCSYKKGCGGSPAVVCENFFDENDWEDI